MSPDPKLKLISMEDVRKMVEDYKPTIWDKTRWAANRLYWKFYYLLFPQQRWLTKVIPRSWSDKSELLPEVVFAFLTDYVDGEKCFEVIEWGKHEGEPDYEAIIKESYDWIKVGRPKLQKAIEEESEVAYRSKSKDYQEKYGKLESLEKELQDKDTEVMADIIKIRGVLWT